MLKTVLFVTHKKTQCWVYEFWNDIVRVLESSKKYSFVHVECWSIGELQSAIGKHNPIAIIYNYHPWTMQWMTNSSLRVMHKSMIADIDIPQIGIIHEVTQKTVDTSSKTRKKWILWLKRHLINNLFDYYIAPDPTITIESNNVFKTWRLIPDYENTFPVPPVTTIGSFGFATWNKGFDVKYVQEEFNEAIIRFNIPFAHFWDASWENARLISEECKRIIYKPGIKLEITHNFFSSKDMLDFLAKNTINVFLYKKIEWESRWISSVIEKAMAVKRPICISGSTMFRHIADITPSLQIENATIKNIIKNRFDPLLPRYMAWQPSNIIGEYEKIIERVSVNNS